MAKLVMVLLFYFIPLGYLIHGGLIDAEGIGAYTALYGVALVATALIHKAIKGGNK